MVDSAHQKLLQDIASALSRHELVQIVRDRFDPDGVASCGCLLAASDRLLLLHRLTDRIDSDGYEVLRIDDISDFCVAFDRKTFYQAALKAKGIAPSAPPAVDLSDMRNLLASVDEEFPLLVIDREERVQDECEIGRIKLLTDTKYALRWLSPEAEWEDDHRTYEIRDVTRVTFDGEYENTLALVAGIAK